MKLDKVQKKLMEAQGRRIPSSVSKYLMNSEIQNIHKKGKKILDDIRSGRKG